MVQDLNESSSSSSSDDEEEEGAAAAAPEAAQKPADQPWETQPAAEAEADVEETAAAADVAVKEEVVEEEAVAPAMQTVVKDEVGVGGEEAAQAGTSDGKRRVCGTPDCTLPDIHTGVCPSLRAEGKRKRKLPAALAEAVMGSNADPHADGGRKWNRTSGWGMRAQGHA